MFFRYALIGSTALALMSCNERKAENAADEAGAAVESAATSVGDAVDDVAKSAPVAAVEDAVGGVVGKAGAVLANSPGAFVENAARSDMYEIESSKLALQKSSSAAVKKFAQSMIDAHSATTAEIKSIVAAGKLATPPAALDDQRQGLIDNLKAAPAGAAFDKAYLTQQTAAHEEALTLLRSYIDDGENAPLKTFATKTAPKVEAHLAMVKGMKPDA